LFSLRKNGFKERGGEGVVVAGGKNNVGCDKTNITKEINNSLLLLLGILSGIFITFIFV
jgi:hypothetical protein